MIEPNVRMAADVRPDTVSEGCGMCMPDEWLNGMLDGRLNGKRARKLKFSCIRASGHGRQGATHEGKPAARAAA